MLGILGSTLKALGSIPRTVCMHVGWGLGSVPECLLNVHKLTCVLTPEADSFLPLRAAQWPCPAVCSLGMLLKGSALLS